MNPNPESNQPAEQFPADEQFPELERHLRHALRHIDPPADFTDSILARATSAPPQPKPKVFRMQAHFRMWAGSALAASLVAGVAIAGQLHARHERQKMEAAQRQFNSALQITNEALQQTREQLRQAGIETGD